MGCQLDQYTLLPEEREKGAESLFKEIWPQTFLTWGKKQAVRSRKFKEFQKNESKEILTKIHYNSTV